MKRKYAGLIAGSLLISEFSTAAAEDLIAARTLRAGEIISAADLIAPQSHAALRRATDVIGFETNHTIYKGAIIAPEALRAPTLIRRNAIVEMEYLHGRMSIIAEGRALDQGARGDRIRVMNLQSKRVVTAIIIGAGTVKAKL